jgi:hypothetical protein
MPSPGLQRSMFVGNACRWLQDAFSCVCSTKSIYFSVTIWSHGNKKIEMIKIRYSQYPESVITYSYTKWAWL